MREFGHAVSTLALVGSLVVALVLVPGAAAAVSVDAGGTAASVADGRGPAVANAGAGVDERVTGDAVVAAGETVTGDLTVLGGSATVHGTVEGDLTVLAGSATVTGEVGGDVTAAAGTVSVAGRVGGDVTAGAGTATVREGAVVDGDLTAGAGSAVVDGEIRGDVTGGNAVRLGSTAVVGGDVQYGDSIERAGGASVAGTVSQGTDGGVTLFGFDVDADGFGFASPLWDLYWVGATLGLGALLLLVSPRFATDLTARGTEDPLRSGAAGLLALVGVPVALVALAVTVVGIPLSLAGVGLFVLALWVAFAYGALVAGTSALALLGVENRWAALLVGVGGVELLGEAPYVGDLVALVVLLVGLGAGALVAVDRRRGPGGAAGEPNGPVEPGVAAD